MGLNVSLEKQQLLISYLVNSVELFTKVNPILKAEYFDDPRAKKAVEFVQSYYRDYKASPTPEQVKAEAKLVSEPRGPLTRQETEYAAHELETFCRNSAIWGAIMASPALLNEGKFGEIQTLIKDAITVSLQRNIGIDYFADPEERLRQLQLLNKSTPTLWTKLDEALAGGLNRKEMIIFAAPPGVGKSLTMSNLARNLMSQGLHGVYFTLELSEEVVCKRFDSIFTEIGQNEILKNITRSSIEIQKQSEGHGSLFVKRLPESSTNANHIRAYLKEFEIVNGFTPDFVVVDYLDLMCSIQTISADNTFGRDKFISEELRSVANEFDLMMITASQLNRSAVQIEAVDDLSQAQIAGGISKVNTTDNLVAIIQTPQMKARNELLYKMLKTRSSGGVGSHFFLNFDPISLRLLNKEIEAAPGGMREALKNLQAKATPTQSSTKVEESLPWN